MGKVLPLSSLRMTHVLKDRGILQQRWPSSASRHTIVLILVVVISGRDRDIRTVTKEAVATKLVRRPVLMTYSVSLLTTVSVLRRMGQLDFIALIWLKLTSASRSYPFLGSKARRSRIQNQRLHPS